MTFRIVAALAMLAALLAPVRAAETYALDADHTYVGFSVRHFGVSNVRGVFKKFSGSFTVDERDVTNSSVVFRIRADSIFTDNDERDRHLKSSDFLDAARHPEIVFTSRKIKKTDGGYIASGELTIRGATQEVNLPFTLAGPLADPLGLMRIGVEAGLTIDRRDYGVSWNKVMDAGGVFVGNEVKIMLSLEATRKTDS